MMLKPNMWIIDCGNEIRWSDDRGGNLFVSRDMAMRTYEKYKEALERIGAKVVEAGLDADLAQMCDLYHEGAARIENQN